LTAILDEAENNTDLYPQRNGQQGHRNTAFSGN
jgi:hypothetical protein